MGDMAKKDLSRAGDILVFLPLAHFLATVCYFTFLTGEIKLSDVFPWLFWFYFPAVLAAVFFIAVSMLHLFSEGSQDGRTGKVLWTMAFFLVTAPALPLYRFTRMKATLCHGPP